MNITATTEFVSLFRCDKSCAVHVGNMHITLLHVSAVTTIFRMDYTNAISNVYDKKLLGRDSSVSIGACYVLDGPGIESR